MFGRKFVAAATTVMLLLMATAAQAAPPSTATLTRRLERGWARRRWWSKRVKCTITESVTGEVTLSFDIVRTVACLGSAGRFDYRTVAGDQCPRHVVGQEQPVLGDAGCQRGRRLERDQ